jgi:HlyD family secretion protein
MPRPRPSARTTALLAVAAVLAAVGAGYLWQRGSAAPASYVTVPIDRGSVAPTVTASGTVNPVTVIQVGTYVSGVIVSLSCDFNTRVRPGQLCATIDPRPYQTVVDQETANLATARAQLEKDRANLAFSKLIFERDAGLLQRGIVSQETVDTARNALDQAQTQIALDQATIQQHQAALDAARINLGYTRIVSPVDGTVVSRNVTQGQTVAASFQTPTLFLVATDLTKMQVDTNISESDIGRIAVGNPASFTVESYPDHPFRGRVNQVRQAPQTVQNVVTYDVVIGVSNADGRLMPGMTASARIVTEQRDGVLRVPAQALRYVPQGAASEAATEPASGAARGPAAQHPRRADRVWVLKDGRPQPVAVTVGLADDNYAEILEGGVREADSVIVSEQVNPSGQAGASGGPRLPRL